MAIKFSSALEVIKNKADTSDAKRVSAQKLGGAEKLGNELPKNCATDFDDIVLNTVELFHKFSNARKSKI